MIRYLDRGGLAVEINGREYEMSGITEYSSEEEGFFTIWGFVNGEKFEIEAEAPKKYFPDEDFGEWVNEISDIRFKGQRCFHQDDWAEGVAWLNDHIEFLVNGEEPNFDNGD